MRRLILASLMAAVAGVGAVKAADTTSSNLYRNAQPVTLSGQSEQAQQQSKAEQAKATAAFKAGYARAGKPKIALFWNRTLSDDVSSTAEVTGTLTSTGIRARDNYQVTIRVAAQSGSEKNYSLAPPPRAAEFESGFQSALREAGAVFVDRSAIIRLSALGKTKAGEQAKDLDYQTLEMSALADYAQYFAEVNFIRDADSTGGLEVRVTVISTSTGEVIADVVPTELYKSDDDTGTWVASDSGFKKQTGGGDTQWRADDAGFYKTTRKKTGIDEGRRVAYALMAQMNQQFPEK